MKMLHIFSIFNTKIATEKFTNFDKFFSMCTDMTDVTIQNNKNVSNAVKDNWELLEPSYMNFLANPMVDTICCVIIKQSTIPNNSVWGHKNTHQLFQSKLEQIVLM